MEFNPTQEESDQIRDRLKNIEGYQALIRLYPTVGTFLDNLPDMDIRTLPEVELMACDALCKIRGLRLDSIKIRG